MNKSSEKKISQLHAKWQRDASKKKTSNRRTATPNQLLKDMYRAKEKKITHTTIENLFSVETINEISITESIYVQ